MSGIVRVLRYEGKRTGTVRSAWVYTPPAAVARLPVTVVYVVHSPGSSAIEWAFIEMVYDLLPEPHAYSALSPPVVVIPIAPEPTAVDSTRRRVQSGTAGAWDAEVGDIFWDLMPLVESGVGKSFTPRQRTLVVIDTSSITVVGRRFGYRVLAGAGDDALDAGFFAAVDKCNQSQPLEHQLRLMWISAHDSVRISSAQSRTVPFAHFLPIILRASPRRAAR